jgi:hypothetical protein
VLNVFILGLRVDKDVVKVGCDKVVKNIIKKVVNISLKCRQSVIKAKGSNKCFI